METNIKTIKDCIECIEIVSKADKEYIKRLNLDLREARDEIRELKKQITQLKGERT